VQLINSNLGSLEVRKVVDIYNIIIQSVSTEAAFDLMENENKLVFIVNRKANKKIIKEAVEKLYKVKVIKVNTLITPQGKKKAFVKLSPEFSAIDIGTKLGLF